MPRGAPFAFYGVNGDNGSDGFGGYNRNVRCVVGIVRDGYPFLFLRTTKCKTSVFLSNALF